MSGTKSGNGSASAARPSDPKRDDDDDAIEVDLIPGASSAARDDAGQSATGATPPSPTSSRAATVDPKERRMAKLRHRAKTMDPPVLSFYGAQPVPLPQRFASIKQKLVTGHEEALQASWTRLIAALREETAFIAEHGTKLIPAIAFDDIGDRAAVDAFKASLKRFGVGIVRGVVAQENIDRWLAETQRYLETKHDIKSPTMQDPTCFDFFWSPAQVRARAHPHVLQAMKFAMSLWDTNDDDRMATRFPISYADRIRIHVPGAEPSAEEAAEAAATSGTLIAQIDAGSLERWEPDGYGRGGTYDRVFAGDWETYDPWDPTGRITASTDLYNGAGACSIFRMFQGILPLTAIRPGMVRLLPSPKLAAAYFLLRPFFSPKNPPPELREDAPPEEWQAFLAPENWELDKEQTTIIHGAVPGHAQRVTELWHPHLNLKESLVTPPELHPGDYIIWHCDTPYTIASGPTPSQPASPTATGASASANEPPAAGANSDPVLPDLMDKSGPPLMVYAPTCPLTQTNALYLARQRKAFLRGHPGPDFDLTGSGLGSEAPHLGRLGESEIREEGGVQGLRAMGMAPWDLTRIDPIVASPKLAKADIKDGATPASAGKTAGGDDSADKMDVDPAEDAAVDESKPSQAEAELVRLANIILFPDKYEFYMPTRVSTPDGKAA